MTHEESDRDRRHHKRRSSREPESDREYRKRGQPDQQRRRKAHRATDSQGELLLPRLGDEGSRDRSPRDQSSRDYEGSREPRSRRESRSGGTSSGQQLSSGGLAQLDTQNAKKGFKPAQYDADYLEEVRVMEKRLEKDRRRAEREGEREKRRADKLVREAEERAREAQAEDERIREEEKEIRREQRRAARRAEKERIRLLEIEEAEAAERERNRGAERDKQRALRRERERQKRREEEEESYHDQTPDHTPRASRKTRYRDEVDYRSSPVGKSPRKTTYRDEVDYTSSPAPQTPIKEPRKSRWWWSKTTYTEIEYEDSPRTKDFDRVHSPKKKTRVVSGPGLEAGRKDEVYEYRKEKSSSSSSSQYTSSTLWKKKRNKRIFIYVSIFVVLLVIIIAVAVVVSKNKKNSSKSSSGSGSSSGSLTSNLDGLSHSEVPVAYQGTYYDPWTWYDTVDFNVTFTSETVGGLPIIGLNSTWNDNVQANSKTPNLQDTFPYGTQPIRGMNIGGWLSLEPFITPSLFNAYGASAGIIDEWTLTTKLGSGANGTLEKHYSSFITKQTFSDIRAAGFDHVRISFSYWAVKTYAGDPYVAMISWRYLLRSIEYARQNGLRVNLDLHGLPGSQNGWNHSGRQGPIGWLNGTDGTLNAQRSLDIHNSLSTFFAQARYKNLVTMYGLANEPRMVVLNTDDVLTWIENATSIVQGNNFTGTIIFGDGFRGLDKWQGELTGLKNMLLDVHQYVVFNNEQLNYDHSQKLNFACGGWTAQTKRSENTATGFGPTLVGEWSQADTDCVTYLNDVNVGSRWTGTLDTGNVSTQVLSPQCYLNSSSCSCTGANAAASTYSSVYKNWLLNFALAQMDSFEYGWGWFYWTWKTESAVQWSWQLGAQAGILPATVYDRSWNCNDSIPDYTSQGLSEAY